MKVNRVFDRIYALLQAWKRSRKAVCAAFPSPTLSMAGSVRYVRKRTPPALPRAQRFSAGRPSPLAQERTRWEHSRERPRGVWASAGDRVAPGYHSGRSRYPHAPAPSVALAVFRLRGGLRLML